MPASPIGYTTTIMVDNRTVLSYLVPQTRTSETRSHVWAVRVVKRDRLAVVLAQILDVRLLALHHQLLDLRVDLVAAKRCDTATMVDKKGNTNSNRKTLWKGKDGYD